VYPGLEFSYDVRVEPAGKAVRIVVDLSRPLPAEWIGRVGFNPALYPGALFGENWALGGETSLFPRQPMGPVQRDADGEPQAVPLATGSQLTVVPGTPEQRLTIESQTGELKLFDARVKPNKGWFIVRSPVPQGATNGATVRREKVSGRRFGRRSSCFSPRRGTSPASSCSTTSPRLWRLCPTWGLANLGLRLHPGTLVVRPGRLGRGHGGNRARPARDEELPLHLAAGRIRDGGRLLKLHVPRPRRPE